MGKWLKSFFDNLTSNGGVLSILLLLFAGLLTTYVVAATKFGADSLIVKNIWEVFLGYSGALLLYINHRGPQDPVPPTPVGP